MVAYLKRAIMDISNNDRMRALSILSVPPQEFKEMWRALTDRVKKNKRIGDSLKELSKKESSLDWRVKSVKDEIELEETKAELSKVRREKEIALFLGVSVAQIDIFLQMDNPIPSVQLGRGRAVKFKYSEVEKWVEVNNTR